MILATAGISGPEDQDVGYDNAKLTSFLHPLHTNCKYHIGFLYTRCESDWGFGLLPRKTSNNYNKQICFILLIDRLALTKHWKIIIKN